MAKEPFAGDKKIGESLFTPLEKKLVAKYVTAIPSWLETYHLTLMTIVWSLGAILFGYLARNNIQWLWGVSVMIVGQYLTDLFDGAVGRHRHTGLIKWGYYMDHFLDYVFLCSLLIGYFFIVPEHFIYLSFFMLALYGAFMVNSFLAFAATNAFRIAVFFIGPTEIRLAFIIVNTLIIVFGNSYMSRLLPYVLGISLLALIVAVYKTQKEIWQMDMDKKYKTKNN